VKEPRHDDERLAALLEGRLEGPERDELLAYLATTEDEDFHVFAKTAAVLREMEEEEDQPAQTRHAGEQVAHSPVRQTLPPSARAGRRRWRALRVIVPPVLAGLVVLVTFTTTRSRAANLGNPIALAESLEGAQQGLPPGWTDTPLSTGGMRGEDERDAVQAGALLMQLAVSIQAQDSVRIATLAEQVRSRFDRRAVPSSPIVQIRNRAGEPGDTLLPLLEQATKRLERLGRDDVHLGAWTEAARLAAAREDVEFFRSDRRRTRTMLQRADDITRGDATGQNAVREIRTLLAGDREPEWDALSTQLRSLMNAIAS
jgi:hypothetical protein